LPARPRKSLVFARLFDAASEQLQIMNRQDTDEKERKSASNRHAAKMREKGQFLDQFLVTVLSRSAVIPTYSFPVHSIRLEVSETRRSAEESMFSMDASLQLDRDAALAIGEYAPGAEVVAGGRIWTSRGIVRRSKEYMPIRYYRLCKSCGHPEIHASRDEFENECEQCSDDPQAPTVNRFIEPTAFLTAFDERQGRDPGSSRLRARPVDEARLLTKAHFRDYVDTDLTGVRTFFAPATPTAGEITSSLAASMLRVAKVGLRTGLPPFMLNSQRVLIRSEAGLFTVSAVFGLGSAARPQLAVAAWVALYSQNMLEIAVELAAHEPAYEELAANVGIQFLLIARTMNAIGPDGMWDEEDGFYYDVLRLPDGSATRLKVRSMVGLLSLCATTVVERWQRERVRPACP
jgi:hypothetical protein